MQSRTSSSPSYRHNNQRIGDCVVVLEKLSLQLHYPPVAVILFAATWMCVARVYATNTLSSSGALSSNKRGGCARLRRRSLFGFIQKIGWWRKRIGRRRSADTSPNTRKMDGSSVSHHRTSIANIDSTITIAWLKTMSKIKRPSPSFKFRENNLNPFNLRCYFKS